MLEILSAKEMAERLHGRNIHAQAEVSPSEEMVAKASGLVIVFGGSDDLIEFRGAIHDEQGAPGDVYLDENGVFESKCREDECPYAASERAKCAGITSVWCEKGTDYSFTYKTKIPHETFDFVEDFGDGEPSKYCRGIVFRVQDIRGAMAG